MRKNWNISCGTCKQNNHGFFEKILQNILVVYHSLLLEKVEFLLLALAALMENKQPKLTFTLWAQNCASMYWITLQRNWEVSYNKHMRVCLINIQTLANRWNKKMRFNQDFFLNITMTDKSLLPHFRCS